MGESELISPPQKISEKIPEGKEKEKPFTTKEVKAVNCILGIGNKGLVREEDMPQAIDVRKWWEVTEPILFAHPRDRELFIGWDLVGDELEGVEINEGLPYEEITQSHAESELGLIRAGQVAGNPHVLVFHSHVEVPEEVKQILAKERKGNPLTAVEQFLDDVPRSYFSEVVKFIKSSDVYTRIIIDVSLGGEELIPILVMVKTKETPVVTKDNYYRYSSRLKNIIWNQLLGGDIDVNFWELFGKEHRKRYKDVLTKDRPWLEEFRLVFYRGFLSRNLEEPQAIRRSDIRLRESHEK